MIRTFDECELLINLIKEVVKSGSIILFDTIRCNDIDDYYPEFNYLYSSNSFISDLSPLVLKKINVKDSSIFAYCDEEANIGPHVKLTFMSDPDRVEHLTASKYFYNLNASYSDFENLSSRMHNLHYGKVEFMLFCQNIFGM